MTPASDGDDEWTYAVEDVSADDEADGDEQAGGEGSVFGPRPDEGREEILPGDPEPEHVLFVVLGVAATLALMLDLVGLV